MPNTFNPFFGRNIVLLGASNLTIGWKPMVQALRATVGASIDLRVALGMGRSYVDWSRFWHRRLPGILQSDLWNVLPQCDDQSPLALLTDIGNDIVYGRTPDTIFTAVTESVSRLRQWNSATRFVMTGLPLYAVASVGPIRFRVARTILFPGCNLSLSSIVTAAEEVDGRCREFAASEGIAFVEPRPEWYGIDPIHVLPKFRYDAFREFFSAWGVTPASTSDAASDGDALSVCRLPKSHVRTTFGIHRVANQPAFDSPGLRVSAY